MWGFISRAKVEFGHTPVGFIGAIFAMSDIIFKLLEPVIFHHAEKRPTPTAPGTETSIPPLDRTGVILVFLICFAFVSQNLVAYGSFKLLGWFSRLPTVAAAPLAFSVVIAAAYLTEYKMSVFAQNVSSLFGGGQQFIERLFLTASQLAVAVTAVLVALFASDNIGAGEHNTTLLFVSAIAYALFCLIFGIAISPSPIPAPSG